MGSAKIVVMIGLVLGTSIASGSIVVTDREDSIVSIRGTISTGLKIKFAESIYLAANILDTNCLLRFPDGGFGLVTESRPVDPVMIDSNHFALEMKTNHYDGSSRCQFQFGMIKLWIAPLADPHEVPNTNFVVFVPAGAAMGGQRVRGAPGIQRVACSLNDRENTRHDDFQCAFKFDAGDAIAAGIPKTGLTIEDLEIVFN